MALALRAKRIIPGASGTAHACPLPIGTPKGWLSPWLEMGTSANQNLYGNLHAQTGGNTGTTPAYSSMAFSTLGEPSGGSLCIFTGSISGTTLSVSSVTSGALAVGMAVTWDTWNYSGTPSATPHPTDSTYHIQSGGGSTWTLTGTPTMAPVSSRTMRAHTRMQGYNASGFERVADPADADKYAFKMSIGYDDYRPSSQAFTTGGASATDGLVGIRKLLSRFGDDGSAPASGQGLICPIGTFYMDAFSVYIPAATKAIAANQDQCLIWQHKNGTGAPGATIDLDSRLYSNSFALSAGTGPRLVYKTYNKPGGSFAQTVLLDDYAAATWIHFLVRVKPGYSSGAVNQVWVAVGDGAPVLKVNDTANNLDEASGGIFRQWGWYMQNDTSYTNGDVNAFPSRSQWWSSGQVMTTYWKDYTVFPQEFADQEPTAAQLAQWFALMRQR